MGGYRRGLPAGHHRNQDQQPQCPQGADDQEEPGQQQSGDAWDRGVEVVDEDVAQADPGVEDEREEGEHPGEAGDGAAHLRAPGGDVGGGVEEEEPQQVEGEAAEVEGADPLQCPAAQAAGELVHARPPASSRAVTGAARVTSQAV